jgi:hypothetical protein
MAGIKSNLKRQARLEHITESPGFNCSGDYIWVIVDGQEDNLGAPFSVFQPPGHFKTVQYRHRDIEYRNFRSQLYYSLKRRLAVTDCPNDVNSCANADTIVPSISLSSSATTARILLMAHLLAFVRQQGQAPALPFWAFPE